MELGRGGMAELYLAYLRGYGGFERVVALKRILPHLAQDPQFKELFLNEGRIAAKVMHQNICTVFELDEADGELFLAMEYLDGVSWDRLITATKPGADTLRLTVAVLTQACEGLHHAHGQHVIHRDVSPQNLFVTIDGTCKVLDFGVSKSLTDGPRTRTGVIKGKLPYMAPEQIRGDALDGRADVFSLGVCAWEALAGRRLFDRETDFAIWKAITEEDVPFVRAYWPQCPPLVDDVIRRALDRDRTRRPATARDFGQLLASAAGTRDGNAYVAEQVQKHFGAQLAEQRREVATALTGKVEASDTIKDGEMRLRSEAKKLEREAASTVDALPRAREAEPKPAAPAKRPLGLIVLVALIAAAVAGGIVAFVMSRQSAPVAQVVPDAEPADDPLGVKNAGEELRRGLEDVRKAGEDLRRIRDEFHGSN